MTTRKTSYSLLILTILFCISLLPSLYCSLDFIMGVCILISPNLTLTPDGEDRLYDMRFFVSLFWSLSIFLFIALIVTYKSLDKADQTIDYSIRNQADTDPQASAAETDSEEN